MITNRTKQFRETCRNVNQLVAWLESTDWQTSKSFRVKVEYIAMEYGPLFHKKENVDGFLGMILLETSGELPTTVSKILESLKIYPSMGYQEDRHARYYVRMPINDWPGFGPFVTLSYLSDSTPWLNYRRS